MGFAQRGSKSKFSKGPKLNIASPNLPIYQDHLVPSELAVLQPGLHSMHEQDGW